MFYIKLDDDMNLVITVREPIYQGDNLNQKIIYLIPKTIGDIDIASARLYLNYVYADGTPDVDELSRLEEMYNDKYYQYTLPVTSKLTNHDGDICTWLDIRSGSTADPIKSKSGECIITVLEGKSVDDYIGDDTISALYRVQTDLDEHIKYAEGEIGNMLEDIEDLEDKVSKTPAGTEERLKNTETKISTLIGADEGKSARKIAAEELSRQLIIEGAKESMDELLEIAYWIQAHPNDAAAMNAAIAALQEKLDTNDQSVATYITAAIDALKIGDYAKSVDLIGVASRVAVNGENITGLMDRVSVLEDDREPNYLCVGTGYSEEDGVECGFHGTMATAKVYSCALTPEQVLERYQQSSSIEHKTCAAIIGDTEYNSLSDALANVNEGDVVTIMAGAHGRHIIESGTYKNVTIVGETGVVLEGLSFHVELENVTIQNIVFIGSALSVYAAYNVDGITIKSCTFNGSYHSIHLADVDKKGYTYANITVDNCVFNMTGSGKYTGVYTQIVDGLTVKNCLFNKANFNAVQIASGASGNIVIVNNIFVEIGSRNVNLNGIKDDFDGTLTIYGNTFSHPTTDSRQVGNYVLLGLEEASPNLLIGVNGGTIDPDKADDYYFYKCEMSSDADSNSFDDEVLLNNSDADGYGVGEADGLIFEIGFDDSGNAINLVDGSYVFTVGDSIVTNDSFINFNGSNGYVLKNFGRNHRNLSQAVTFETYFKISSLDNIIYILSNTFNGINVVLKVDQESKIPIFDICVNGVGHIVATSSVSMDVGTYHHLVGSYDGEYICIYVDGKAVGKSKAFYAPQRGTDYWTADDKALIVEDAAKTVEGRSTPQFVFAKPSLDDSGCTELILPDGIDIKDGLLVSYYSLKTSANDRGVLKIGNVACPISRLISEDPFTTGLVGGNQSLYNVGDTIVVRLTYFPEYTIDGYTTPEYWEAVLVGVLSEYVFAEKVLGGSFSGVVSASPWTQAPDSSLIRNSSLLPSNGGVVVPSFNGEINWFYA